MQEKQKKVLICPLDWGLGHATRCIPLIHSFLDEGAEVLIAASGKPALLLKQEFPSLQLIDLPGVTIHYGDKGFSFPAMLFQLPSMLLSVWKEHQRVNDIIAEHNINIIISDNRYGLWSDKCYAVFITHQLNIKLPSAVALFEKSVNRFAAYFIKKFDMCIVPDTSEHQLAGELSSSEDKKINCVYSGPLSRFKKNVADKSFKQYNILVILSGPEPQRTLAEQKITEALRNTSYSVLLVRGMADGAISQEKNIEAVHHLSTEELNFHLLKSDYIICRSGYSSIMDLAAVGRSAVIIPTPGQTEQEYLAILHHDIHHYAMKQDDIDLKALEMMKQMKALHMETEIQKLVQSILQKTGIDF